MHRMTVVVPMIILTTQMVCVQLCFGDRLLNRADVELLKYQDTPKNWFKYLKALLSHLLTKVTQLVPGYKNLAEKFKDHTNQLQSFFHIVYPVCYAEKFARCVGQKVVSECLGQIKTSNEHIHPQMKNTTKHTDNYNIFAILASKSLKTFFNKDHLYYSLKSVWQFYLDSALSLNISFQHIDFLLKPKYCQDDNLSIYPLNMKHKFIVCHKQSAFNLYLSGNRISIVLTSFRSVHSHFSVHVLFAVFDEGVLRTDILPQALKGQDVGAFLSLLMKYKSKMFEVLTFHVEVSKRLVLVLHTYHCAQGTYVAYDGPGVLSPRVLLSHGQYTMSSFQCVYQQVGIISTTGAKCKLSYKSRQLPAQWKLHVSTATNMSYFSLRSICRNSPCTGYLKTAQRITMNLTILHLVLKSSEALSCKYGALHIVGIGDKYDTNIFCDNHSSSVSPSIGLYLEKPSVWTVLYWYQFYTEIEVVLSLTTTHCNVTIYDVCTDPRLSQMAGILQNLQPSWHNIQTNLKSVIHNRTDAESFQIQYQVLFESSCTIWQIRHNAYVNEYGPVTCLSVMQPSAFLKANVRISLTGKIKSNLYFKSFGIGFPNQFCSVKHKTLQCETNVRKFDVYELDDSFVLLMFNGFKATYKQSIDFFINIPGKVDEWIDCEIRTHMAIPQTETQGSSQPGLPTSIHKHLPGETVHPIKSPPYSATLIISDHLQNSTHAKKKHMFHMVWCTGIAKTNLPIVMSLLLLTPWNQVQVTKAHHSLSFVLFTDSNSTLSLLLHHDKSHLNLAVSNCEKITSLIGIFKHCHILRFSCAARYSNQTKKLFIFIGHQAVLLKRDIHFSSWYEAYNTCRNIGGDLPSIQSQSDLRYIVHVVENIFPFTILEALYIGLISSAKVCFSCLVFLLCQHKHHTNMHPVTNILSMFQSKKEFIPLPNLLFKQIFSTSCMNPHCLKLASLLFRQWAHGLTVDLSLSKCLNHTNLCCMYHHPTIQFF